MDIIFKMRSIRFNGKRLNGIIRCWLLTIVLFISSSAYAGINEILSDTKISGCLIGEYTYKTEDNIKPNNYAGFRVIRLMLDGKIKNDFYYRIQMQANGISGNSNGPHVVDCYMEWQKYDFFRIKLGEFKRAFTFENPIHPADQGFYGYAQSISKLTGMSDRNGEHQCNGRDIGVHVQGDLFRANEHRYWLHYQLGVYNGQGINVSEVDNRKDIIGGIWVMPVDGLQIGAFGWAGNYARNDGSKIVSVNRNRYSFGVNYNKDDLTLRSEYIHSEGRAFKNQTLNDATIDENLGDEADGWYAALIYPIKRNLLHVKARYDSYRANATWATSNNQYEVGVDYFIAKNLKFQFDYAFVNNRTLEKHNYHMVDCQMIVRF